MASKQQVERLELKKQKAEAELDLINKQRAHKEAEAEYSTISDKYLAGEATDEEVESAAKVLVLAKLAELQARKVMIGFKPKKQPATQPAG